MSTTRQQKQATGSADESGAGRAVLVEAVAPEPPAKPGSGATAEAGLGANQPAPRGSEEGSQSSLSTYMPKVAVSAKRTFPGRHEVDVVAGALEESAGLEADADGVLEDTGCRLIVGPGGLQITVKSGTFDDEPFEFPENSKERPKRGEVVGWSPKSRANMVRRLAMLDYEPLVDPARLLTMVTLTYPGCGVETGAAERSDLCARCGGRAARMLDLNWGTGAPATERLESWRKRLRGECGCKDGPSAESRRHVCTEKCAWYDVAPSGDAVKGHLERWRKRYARAWGEPWRGVWKQEFQARGAPHFHLCMCLPSGRSRSRVARFDGLVFADWLGRTWADVVGHPDEDVRRMHENAGTFIGFREQEAATDPVRVAVYFSKHAAPGMSSKEYQNRPPALWTRNGGTPGRFWGSVGLESVEASVEISEEQALMVRRILRRWSRRRTRYTKDGAITEPALRRVTVERKVTKASGEVKIVERKVTRRVRRYRSGPSGRVTGGFSLFNNAPEVGVKLARALDPDGTSEPGGYSCWLRSD